MPHVSAGALDRQLYVKSLVTSVDEDGASTKTYDNEFWVWAHKRTIRTDSKNLNNQDQPIADVEFTVYYDDRIGPNCQVKCDGVTYQIVQPSIEFGRHEMMKLVCRAHDFTKAV